MGSRTVMNALDARGTDALTELFNIAAGLTASKLSEISGSRVLINVPILGMDPMDDLAKELGSRDLGGAVAVHQAFTGPISGDAMLFLDYEGAVRLSNLFVENGFQSDSLDSSSGEILTEIGNMLLGSCLGGLVNLLELRVTFFPPVLHLESLKPFLTSVSSGGDERRDALVMASSFNILQHEVGGQFAIALGASSIKRLVQAADVWEGTQYAA